MFCHCTVRSCFWNVERTQMHWKVHWNHCRKLKNDKFLHVTRGSSLSLHSFTDIDLVSNIDDWKSIGSYLVCISLIFLSLWNMKSNIILLNPPQKLNTRFWLMTLLKSYGFVRYCQKCFPCNNLGATFLSVNHVFHAYYKHVEVNYHFVCDQVAKKKIQVRFISSKDLLVDVLTKPLPSASFAHFQSKLRV
jgi:hypothetical protein